MRQVPFLRLDVIICLSNSDMSVEFVMTKIFYGGENSVCEGKNPFSAVIRTYDAIFDRGIKETQ